MLGNARNKIEQLHVRLILNSKEFISMLCICILSVFYSCGYVVERKPVPEGAQLLYKKVSIPKKQKKINLKIELAYEIGKSEREFT